MRLYTRQREPSPVCRCKSGRVEVKGQLRVAQSSVVQTNAGPLHQQQHHHCLESLWLQTKLRRAPSPNPGSATHQQCVVHHHQWPHREESPARGPSVPLKCSLVVPSRRQQRKVNHLMKSKGGPAGEWLARRAGVGFTGANVRHLAPPSLCVERALPQKTPSWLAPIGSPKEWG